MEYFLSDVYTGLLKMFKKMPEFWKNSTSCSVDRRYQLVICSKSCKRFWSSGEASGVLDLTGSLEVMVSKGH